MRAFLLMLFSSIAYSQVAYRHDGKVLLPDRHATPGVVSDATAHDLCNPAFHTGSVRKVTPAMKRRVYASYGVKPRKGVCCEVDHLISLEIGGANDQSNLWPQPWAQARQKDVLENRLHKLLCAGQITLAQAQKCIADDWLACYKQEIGH